MTLVSYTNGNSPSTSFLTNRRRKLVGTAHSGPHWVNAVRVLRAATVNAYAQDAAWGRLPPRLIASAPRSSTESSELDSRALHVLSVVFAILVRAASQHK